MLYKYTVACSSAPFAMPYMATLTPWFNFGNQQAAVIQRLNTSSATILLTIKDKDNGQTNNLVTLANPVYVRQSNLGPKYTITFAN